MHVGTALEKSSGDGDCIGGVHGSGALRSRHIRLSASLQQSSHNGLVSIAHRDQKRKGSILSITRKIHEMRLERKRKCKVGPLRCGSR